MNALWLWRNRNGRVSFWWELLHWMNNLCNCCLLVCRAWILPDRCVWRTVSDCGDCTNTSCSASPLKLSEYLLKWSSLRPWSFPRQGVQAECLGHAGSASVPSCTLCSALRDSSPLPSLIWHLYFTDVTTCLDWPKMPNKHWPKGSSHLPWLPQPVFHSRNNQGHMILIQTRICSISLLWFRHLGGKEKKECDPWRYSSRRVKLEFG